ncbi:MAG TPA: hypothetical protein DCF62_03680 [Porticoccaceae bacterium]|nr:hypothetical protein [Porticoccaceae bacterium]HCO60492.1 hypothetical protein [Porticoccaceae bacterium]
MSPIKNTDRGFTLLELLVVIVLMVAVISVVSVNVVSGLDSSRVKTSARQLATVLRSARTEALSSGVEAGIVLGRRDRDTGESNLDYGDLAGTLHEASGEQRSYTVLPAGQWIDLPGGMSLSLSNGGGARGALVPPGSLMFYPDGSSTGGRLEVQAGSDRLTIEVDWLTGEVRFDAFSG